MNIPDFIYKQSATFFRRIMPNREAKLKKMFSVSKKKKAEVVSISSRHLHSSVASSKMLLPFDPSYKEKVRLKEERNNAPAQSRGLRPIASEMKFVPVLKKDKSEKRLR